MFPDETRDRPRQVMHRDAAFHSGLPMLMASICMLVLGYLAIIRHERLARYWAVAWCLLLVRYVANTVFPDAEYGPLSIYAKELLRLAFAMVVLAGVFALRGTRVRPWWIVAASLGLTLSTHVAAGPSGGNQFVLSGILVTEMTIVLGVAAWSLAQAQSLPRFERRVTASALAIYALSSATAPMAMSGSSLFTSAFMTSMGSQVMAAFGLLATFFRMSHDAEMAAQVVTETRLTTALGEFVSVCMHCKSVRDEDNEWQPLERFVTRKTPSQLSHGLCPDCAKLHYSEVFKP